MADTDVIGEVSSTLERVLTAAMLGVGTPPFPVAKVHDLRGSIPTSPPLLTLFLYDIARDPTVRNRGTGLEVDVQGYRIRRPPLGLVLRYLVTAWGGDPITEQQMIGRVLQALHDGAILSGADLTGTLATSGESLAISLATLTLEEKSRVWYAIQQPYRVSLNYEIRVASIESAVADRAAPVSAVALDTARPDPVR